MSDTIQNTLYYPPDRDLSSGQCYPPIERWGSRLHLSFSAVRKPSGGIKQQLEFYKQPSDRTSYLTSAGKCSFTWKFSFHKPMLINISNPLNLSITHKGWEKTGLSQITVR